MSVFDQQFGKQSSGCFGFNLSPDSFSFGSFEGVGKKHQAVVTTEDDKQKKEEVDTLLSEAMNTLTFKEREEQQAVLHGVDDEMHEEQNFVENALQDLDALLIRKKAGSVFEIAERMDPTYVRARAFRIMFLRGNRYDTKAAANQMLKFFELKQQLFGNDKMTKDITIDDMDEDDREALKVGFFQLAGRDMSNRQIIVQMPGVRNCKVKNELRGNFFTLMAALRSEETQLNGIVMILYTIGDLKDRSKGAGFFEHTRLGLSVPVHHAAVHCCLDDPDQYILIKIGLAVVNAKLRARIRVHYGSHLEAQYLLSTYGISAETLPLTASCKLNMTRHWKWVDSFVRGTSSRTNIGVVPSWKSDKFAQPTASDVLYRGGNKINNAGNDQLRSLVAEWSHIYDTGTTDAKRRVVNELIDEIHRSGGRFLIQVNDAELAWAALPMDDARMKITQMFRNHRRKLRGSRKKKTKS